MKSLIIYLNLVYTIYASNYTASAQEKAINCQQSCLGELVCTKTCDFLDELESKTGGSIKDCIEKCSDEKCTNTCVFKSVGLPDAEVNAYVIEENALAPCREIANNASTSCINKVGCLKSDMQCVGACADQLNNPDYVNCVANNTHTTTKEVDAMNACRQDCLKSAHNLKDSYECGVKCSGPAYHGLNIDISKMNLTDLSNSTNVPTKYGTPVPTSFIPDISQSLASSSIPSFIYATSTFILFLLA